MNKHTELNNREKIKIKVEKLLRLSLSKNENEAKLAAEKAIELMQLYAIKDEELSKNRTITKRFDIKYVRIPVWIRELYNGLSYVNGCYMAWSNGRRDRVSGKITSKAKIFLTGREADVLNTEYFLYVFIREIEILGEKYKKSLPKEAKDKRTRIKHYKIGVGQGLCERLLNATEKLENSELGKDLVVRGNHHERFMTAMNKFINNNKVSYIVDSVDESHESFNKGLKDAKAVEIKRPLRKKDELELKSLKKSKKGG